MNSRLRAALFAAAIAFAAKSTSVIADTTATYIGGPTGSWSNAANWSTNPTVPNGAFSVFIDGGNTGQNSAVTTDGSFSVDSLTVDLGDSLTITTNTNFTFNGSTVTNNGNITFGSDGSSFQDTFFNGNVTFAGTGVYNLQGADRFRDAGNNNGVLINDSTIQGFTSSGGTFGFGSIAIVNQTGGLIDANLSSKTLSIQTDSSGLTNQGTLLGSNGGTLQIIATGITNTGGNITATGTGSIVQLVSNSSVSGGNLSGTGGGLIELTNVTFNNVTLSGNVSQDDNTNLTLNGTITNNGNLLMNSGSSFVDMFINGNVTLAGNGTLTLQNNDRIRDAGSNNGNLTNNSTIQGFTTVNSGTFGFGSVAITNSATGLIDANVAGKTLVIAPNSAGVNNQGLLRASNGGILQLTGGVLFNNTGTILATGAGSVVQLNANASVNGNLTATSGGIFEIPVNQTANVSNITLTGTMNEDDDASLHLTGNITINGALNMNSATNFTDLFINGNVTLTGNGTLNFQNFDRIRDNGSNNGILINSITIQGFTSSGGTLGLGNIGIINTATGIIDSNTSGKPLLIQPSVAGLTNQGLLRASNGGLLQLSGGTNFDNTTGTILATGAGSVVQLTSNASTNGNLSTSNGGLIEIPVNQTASASNITLNGTMNQDDEASLHLFGNITINGSLNMNSVTNFTDLFLSGNVALTGNGTLNFQNDDRIRDNGSNNGILVNGITIQGFTTSGSIGIGSIGIINTATGIIDSNTSGQTLLIQPSAAGLINQGLLRASNGGLLRLSGGTTFDNTIGTILATGAGSVVQFVSNPTIGGTLLTNNGGLLELVAGQTATLSSVSLTGTMNEDDQASLYLVGNSTINGALNMNSATDFTDLFISGNVTLSGNGSINLQNLDRIRDAGGGTGNLTNNIIIQGYTTSGASLGIGGLGIVNAASGIIDANVTGKTLVVAPTTDPRGFNNAGILRATNGGTLLLTGGVSFTNTGSILAIGTGSVVQFQGSFPFTGNLTSTGGGIFEIPVNQTATGGNFTLTGTLNEDDDATFSFSGNNTINGTINANSTTDFTELFINGNVTLSGNGTLNLQNFDRIRNGSAGILTNDITIQGYSANNSASIGIGGLPLINDVSGIINANTASKTLFLSPVGTLSNSGILRASNGGTLDLTGSVVYTNTATGTFEALNSSTVTMDVSTVLSNDIAGFLTLGTYRAVSTGGNATVALQGLTITTIALNTTVELNGIGSVITVGGTPVETNLAENDGTLKVLGNRTLSAANVFLNTGLLQLGGGTFTETSLNNSTTGTILGFGTITDRPLNNGIIESNGGILAFSDGIDPLAINSTMQSDAGSTLDVSAGADSSQTGFLINNGNLTIGANNVSVALSYTNPAFGSGDLFNKHANVSASTGEILADGDNTELLSTSSLNFQHVHVGTTNNLTYTITNSGTNGPSVLYAIRPTTDGGTISDSRLTGTGVSGPNVGPLAIGVTSASLTITFTASAAGALTNQVVDVDNNFDNIADQTLSIAGAAYRFALPTTAAPNPVTFPNVHVGDTVAPVAISVTNNVPADGFSEKLDGSLTGVANSGITLAGSFNLLLPTASSSAITATLDTSSAGFKTSSATFDFISDGQAPGTLDNSGLGQTALTADNQSLTASGSVFRFATPSTVTNNPVLFTNVHVGDTVAPITLAVSNTDPADGFSEKLDASLTSPTSSGITLSGSVSLLSPNSSTNAFSASLDTSTPGHKTASATVSFSSDGQAPGTIGNSGLGVTSLVADNQSLTASGNVFRLATPSTVTSNPATFTNFHVGDTAAPITLAVSNTDLADGFSEKLDGSLTNVTSSGITLSGSVSLLSPSSSTNAFTASLDTSTAGHKTASATATFSSDGQAPGTPGNSGLGVTPLPALSQSLSASGNVYRLASPGTINQTVYNLGPVHVNQVVTVTPSFSNTDPADGFSETLLVHITTHTANVTVTNSSTDGVVQPNSSNSGFVSLALNTSTAQLGVTGSQTFHFRSDGSGATGGVNDNLGVTDLSGQDQSVTINADVLNYAAAALNQVSGNGNLIDTDPTHYTLDLGTLNTGDQVSTLLGILNDVAGPADTLSGTWAITSGSGFNITGISPFSGIIAGNSAAGPSISLTAGSVSTNLSEILTLTPSSDDSNGSTSLSPISLTIDAAIIGTTPEPASLTLLGLGAATLLLKRRRK